MVRDMNVFSSYLISFRTASQEDKTIARVISKIMNKHPYLPNAIVFGKVSAFVKQELKEVADLMGIALEHATTKLAQTNGMLEKMHASLITALKIEMVEKSVNVPPVRRPCSHQIQHVL